MNVAVVALKGGVGKTTLAVNLAAALAHGGRRRVLLVDCDPQGSASSWLRVPASPMLGAGIVERSPLVPVETPWNVDVLPASPGLAALERTLAGEPGAETLLREALAPLRYDLTIIDTPPGMSLLVVQALVAAARLLVPVEAAPLALQGVVDLEMAATKVRTRLNEGLHEADVVVSRASRTRVAREVTDALRERYGARVCRTVVRETARLREAPAHGPIVAYDPEGTSAADVQALARELTRRWGL